MGEKRVKQKLEIARRHKATSQVGQVTFQFPVKSLGHSCWPFLFLSCAWLGLAWWLRPCLAGGWLSLALAGCGWPWLAGAGPGWLGRALAGGWLPSPAVARLGAWRAWAGGLQHTQHTLTKLTPPPHLERGEPGCVLSKLTPPLVADTSGDSEVSSERTHATLPHTADCTAVFSCCLTGDK